MIEHIFILLESGQLLFSDNYTEVEMMDDLVAGFISALQSFARENAIGEMRCLTLSKKKYTYALSGGLIFVLVSDLEANSVLLENLLSKIKTEFLTKYGHLLDSFGGSVALFADFKKDLQPFGPNFNDLTVHCDTCNKIIPGSFLTLVPEDDNLKFCCESCKMLFKRDSQKVSPKEGKPVHEHHHSHLWEHFKRFSHKSE